MEVRRRDRVIVDMPAEEHEDAVKIHMALPARGSACHRLRSACRCSVRRVCIALLCGLLFLTIALLDEYRGHATGLELSADERAALRSRLPPVYVSLTTTSRRVKTVHKTILSLWDQSMPPDVVHLYLSVKPYLIDEGVPADELPEELEQLRTEDKLQVHFVHNTGPFRKLLPLLKLQKDIDCLIVTTDDDEQYPTLWLESLLRAFDQQGGNAVVAARGKMVTLATANSLTPYRTWPLVSPEMIRMTYASIGILPTGVGGVVYRPRFFNDDVFDEAYMKLAPKTDDLWFKIAAASAGTKVFLVSAVERITLLGVLAGIKTLLHKGWSSLGFGNDKPLWAANVGSVTGGSTKKQGGNDQVMAGIIDFFRTEKNYDYYASLREQFADDNTAASLANSAVLSPLCYIDRQSLRCRCTSYRAGDTTQDTESHCSWTTWFGLQRAFFKDLVVY